ncbi:MAG: hypothetical protein IPM46_11185 [Flavobacteriales bacterium]|nr:hypothetical protein [Flavobacteriales bacterium]
MRRIPVLLALLPTVASAQIFNPVTNEFRVNQNVPSEQFLPQLAMGPSDDYVVVWKSWMQDDNTASIYFRRYNSAHIAISSELLVATGSNYQETYVVKVYYWTAGRFIIAWNTASGLYMRVLEADNTLGATVNLGGGGLWDLAIRGNTLTMLYGSGNDVLNIRNYDLGINSFTGPAVLVTEDPNNDYEHPNIRYKSDGTLMAIFGRGNYPQRIYRKTFDADLLAQTNETLVYEQNSSLNCIDVSTNASDEILISTKWGVNGTDVFKVWILDGNGALLLNNLTTFSSSYAYYTSECALFDNGDFVTVMGTWTSLNDTENYNVRGFYASNYNFQNSGVQVLNTTIAGVQAYPAVEKRADGGFVVVWEGNGFQGDTEGINARVWSGVSFPGVQAGTNTATVVDETGTTGVVELRLGTQPTGNVVVDLSVNDATEASIDIAQMTFTSGNWNVPQNVTVTGLDDPLDDGDINLSLVATMNGATADPAYAAMGPKLFAVTNRDDDAVFTLPFPPPFCRDIGMAAVNVLVTNAGVPVGSPIVTSSDQAVVDDADISVQQLNATTFAISISSLTDNIPGTAAITLTVSDAYFSYSSGFGVTTLGAVPVITQDGSLLTVTPAGVSYQWYLNGAFIPGGTQQSWTASENGTYTVLVVDADGCYSNSADIVYNSTGIEAVGRDCFRAGPLTDVLPLFAPQAGVLRMIDAGGREVASARVVVGLQWIPLPGLATGVYTVLLQGATARVVKE